MKTIKKKAAKRLPRQQQPVAPAAETSPALISVTLSKQASALVRWYCGVTKHDPEDAIHGALMEAIGSAKVAYERPFDDSFDILLRHVLDAQDLLRDGRVPFSQRRASVELDERASELARRYRKETGREAGDIASAALVYALNMTFGRKDGKEEDCRKDEAWQYFEEEVSAAAKRRLGIGEEVIP